MLGLAEAQSFFNIQQHAALIVGKWDFVAQNLSATTRPTKVLLNILCFDDICHIFRVLSPWQAMRYIGFRVMLMPPLIIETIVTQVLSLFNVSRKIIHVCVFNAFNIAFVTSLLLLFRLMIVVGTWPIALTFHCLVFFIFYVARLPVYRCMPIFGLWYGRFCYELLLRDVKFVEMDAGPRSAIAAQLFFELQCCKTMDLINRCAAIIPALMDANLSDSDLIQRHGATLAFIERGVCRNYAHLFARFHKSLEGEDLETYLLHLHGDESVDMADESGPAVPPPDIQRDGLDLVRFCKWYKSSDDGKKYCKENGLDWYDFEGEGMEIDGKFMDAFLQKVSQNGKVGCDDA
ncbi:MAG: hypothetical protein LBP65_04110 [Puniceicoccales bacterium]|jgi:hypothetical protein|nr:hypothetical protein [Puniceicoccales bacterium]